ncbi:hypothetical protein AB0H73_21980 [Streptomyces olivoreticuli]
MDWALVDTPGQAIRWLRRHVRAVIPELEPAAQTAAYTWLADQAAYRRAVNGLARGEGFLLHLQLADADLLLVAEWEMGRGGPAGT